MKKKVINFFGVGGLYVAAMYHMVGALNSFEKEDFYNAFLRYIQAQYMFIFACSFLIVVMIDLLLAQRERGKCDKKDEAKEQNEKADEKEIR